MENHQKINIYVLIVLGVVFFILSAWLFFSQEQVYEEGKEENGETEAFIDERLTGVSWKWSETIYLSGEVFIPDDPESFILVFGDDGRVSALTDCNNMMGGYETSEEGELGFSEMASTLMYCEDSQEGDFREMMALVRGYSFGEEHLFLVFERDEGMMVFEAVEPTEY